MNHLRNKVLDYLKTYIQENGYAPSYREIADGTGLKSTGAVSRVLIQMQAAGDIDFQPGLPRTLRLIAESAERGESAEV